MGQDKRILYLISKSKLSSYEQEELNNYHKDEYIKLSNYLIYFKFNIRNGSDWLRKILLTKVEIIINAKMLSRWVEISNVKSHIRIDYIIKIQRCCILGFL